MKTMISIIAAFFALLYCASAQNLTAQQIFDKYEGKDGFTTISLGDLDIFGEDIGQVNSVKILAFDPEKHPNNQLGQSFAADLKSVKLSPDYKKFLSIKDDGDDVNMLYKKNDSKVVEFLMIAVQKDGESTIIWVTGDLNLKNIGNVGKSLMKAKKGDKEEK